MTWRTLSGLFLSAFLGTVVGWFLSFDYVNYFYSYDHGGDTARVMFVLLPACALVAMLIYLLFIRKRQSH